MGLIIVSWILSFIFNWYAALCIIYVCSSNLGRVNCYASVFDEKFIFVSLQMDTNEGNTNEGNISMKEGQTNIKINKTRENNSSLDY